MRKILVEWLVDVVEEAKMKGETLFLAINFLDRFLSSNFVDREQLLLVRGPVQGCSLWEVNWAEFCIVRV